MYRNTRRRLKVSVDRVALCLVPGSPGFNCPPRDHTGRTVVVTSHMCRDRASNPNRTGSFHIHSIHYRKTPWIYTRQSQPLAESLKRQEQIRQTGRAGSRFRCPQMLAEFGLSPSQPAVRRQCHIPAHAQWQHPACYSKEFRCGRRC